MRLFLIFVISLAALAQQPAQRKNIVGSVEAIAAGGKQLTLKSDAGVVYTVATDDKTKFERVTPGPDSKLDMKQATALEPSEIVAGDRLLARGVVSEESKKIEATTIVVLTKADVAQTQKHELEEWKTRGIAGTVTAINPDTKEVTIKTDSIPPRTVVVDASHKVEFMRYAPDSMKFSDAKPSAFADVKVGDRLRALGEKKEEGGRYTAQEIISGSFRTLAVQVVSVDPATNTIKATDLQTKDKQPVTIHVNAETVARRMPEQMARMMAMRLNAQTGGAAGGPAGSGGPGAGGRQRRPGGAGEGEGANRGRQSEQGGPGPAGNMAQMGGGPGGYGGTHDLQQIFERLPEVKLDELKPGDALIISTTSGADRSNVTAIMMVAGVEPFLAAAPKRAGGGLDLGGWSFDASGPEQ